MDRYFIDGKEVSNDIAEAVLATNDLIMQGGKFEELINCKFAIIIKQGESRKE